MNTKHIVVCSPSFAATGIERFTVSLLRSLDRSIQRCAEAYRRHQQYKHLEDLPDYLLKDIGVSRWEVREAVRRNTF